MIIMPNNNENDLKKCFYHRFEIKPNQTKHKCIYCNFVLDELDIMFDLFKKKHDKRKIKLYE